MQYSFHVGLVFNPFGMSIRGVDTFLSSKLWPHVAALCQQRSLLFTSLSVFVYQNPRHSTTCRFQFIFHPTWSSLFHLSLQVCCLSGWGFWILSIVIFPVCLVSTFQAYVISYAHLCYAWIITHLRRGRRYSLDDLTILLFRYTLFRIHLADIWFLHCFESHFCWSYCPQFDFLWAFEEPLIQPLSFWMVVGKHSSHCFTATIGFTFYIAVQVLSSRLSLQPIWIDFISKFVFHLTPVQFS